MAAHIANLSYEANKNPIPEEPSAEDETVIVVFPGGKEGMNVIPEESLAGDETIIAVFPGEKDGVNPNIPEESSAGDETIIGVFPGGKDDGMTPNPPEESSTGDETVIGVFPGGNDETDENPTSQEYPSIENDPSSTYKQPSSADEEIVIIPGFIPQDWTRKEPEKKASNRGIPGRTR